MSQQYVEPFAEEDRSLVVAAQLDALALAAADDAGPDRIGFLPDLRANAHAIEQGQGPGRQAAAADLASRKVGTLQHHHLHARRARQAHRRG